jgi:RNA polymerase sigma-70 factor (ECF subfamily)
LSDTPTRTPDELLAAARAGDREALGQLLQHVRPYLAVVAARAAGGGRRPAECDSEVQEALARAVASLARFRAATFGEFLAWLAAIVRNQVLDRRRRPQPQPLPEDAGGEVSLPAGGSTPSSAARRREEAARLLAALQRLPERQREVIRLRHFEGKPHAEVAAALGLSTAAVRQLWHRTLLRLREELGGDA